MVFLGYNSPDAVLIICVDGLHQICTPGNDQRMRKHPRSKGKGLGDFGTTQGLRERRREKPYPSFEQVNKGAVLQMLETEQSDETVTLLE
jgi:hypothetical protein